MLLLQEILHDVLFLRMYRKMLFGLVKSYDPHAIVLCLGADGLQGDALISGLCGDSMGSSFDFAHGHGEHDAQYEESNNHGALSSGEG